MHSGDEDLMTNFSRLQVDHSETNLKKVLSVDLAIGREN